MVSNVHGLGLLGNFVENFTNQRASRLPVIGQGRYIDMASRT